MIMGIMRNMYRHMFEQCLSRRTERVLFEALAVRELGSIEPDMSKVTTLQSTVHQLHQLRDSGTQRCHNERGPEE
jgi:hypothetical protein